MFDYIKYRFQLQKLQKKKRSDRKSYNADYQQARRNKDEEKRQSIFSLMTYEADVHDDKILRLQSKYLIEEAARYVIPMPRFGKGKAWIESEFTGKWRLSPDAAMKLQAQIHEVKKQRREIWMPWWVMGIGLIGSLTGLISVLKN